MANVKVLALVFLIRIVCYLWELIVLPLYVIIFKPAHKLLAKRRSKSRNIGITPAGPYRSTEVPPPPAEKNDKGEPIYSTQGLITSPFDGVDSIYELFLRSASKWPDRDFLGTRTILKEVTETQPDGKVFKKVAGGPYVWMTYRQASTRISQLSAGFRALGLGAKDRLLIFCETRADWLMAALAAFANNITIVTLYATLGEQAVLYGIRETEVTHMVTSTELLPKLKKIAPELEKSKLRTIIVANTPTPIQNSAPLSKDKKEGTSNDKSKPEAQPGKASASSNTPSANTANTAAPATESKNIGAEWGAPFSLYSFDQVASLGDSRMAATSADGVASSGRPSKEDLAMIMFTSGTTGIPKGVLLSHSNFLSCIAGGMRRLGSMVPLSSSATEAAASSSWSGFSSGLAWQPSFRPLSHRDRFCAYLPQAHVLELICEFTIIASGGAIGYSSPTTLADNSTKVMTGTKGDITVLRPTVTAMVPAIVERITKLVKERVHSGKSELLRALFDWSYDHKRRKLRQGLDTPILNRVIFKKVRKLLGGRVRLILIGSAPLSQDAQEFMNVCFACTIALGYGLTESSGGVALLDPDDALTFNNVGAPIASLDLLLRNWDEGGYRVDDKPNPRGEILLSGANIVQGYFQDPTTNNRVFLDIHGRRWFATEDIGEMHPDGTLAIIDRKKDMIKLQHGEYVALGKIETILGSSKYVEQLCVCGRSAYDYVVALVVPKRSQIEELAKSIGIPYPSAATKEKGQPPISEAESLHAYEQLCSNPKLVAALNKQLTQLALQRGLDKFEVPRRIALFSELWTPDSGLLTDAMKLKRREFDKKYREIIDKLYTEPASDSAN